MSSYGSGFRNSVPAQQGTTLYGTSYGATDSQSTASSYYNDLHIEKRTCYVSLTFCMRDETTTTYTSTSFTGDRPAPEDLRHKNSHQSLKETWGLFCSMHHMGCCRMGTTVGNGTIDAHGESWEAEQLYVCNDSVLPTAVGINPMITVQSVAYCVANGIADSLSGKTT
uniref:Alcohol oxidase-like n=1 Tax=Oryza sativa subsp. japonica TaxID=39947 RepID=Q6ZDK8_ORYSJ|nr:alcohol oxidase-like [Oryza sativa Japonica Group]